MIRNQSFSAVETEFPQKSMFFLCRPHAITLTAQSKRVSQENAQNGERPCCRQAQGPQVPVHSAQPTNQLFLPRGQSDMEIVQLIKATHEVFAVTLRVRQLLSLQKISPVLFFGQ